MASSRARVAPSRVADTESAPAEVTSGGKRVKAVPFSGGTTIVVRSSDFDKAGNIDHPDVTWDYRVDGFTVEVGKGITAEAADFLVNNYPDSFRFVEG